MPLVANSICSRVKGGQRKISGQIMLRGSTLGIPRLLVTVYNSNFSTTTPSSGRPPISEAPSIDADGDSNCIRLGSVFTDDRGTFKLALDDQNKTRAHEQRPDLVLVVSPPEESCTPDGLLHSRIATCTRRCAGSVESFLIFVDQAQLAKAGISIPGDAEELIKHRRVALQRQEKLQAESLRLFAEMREKRRNFERLAEPKFERFLSALSAVPEERRKVSDGRYVPRGTSVLAVHEAVLQSIQERINKTSVTGRLALNDEQLAKFKDEHGRFLTSIRSDEIETLLRPKQHGRGPMLVYRRPPAITCREGPVDPCVEILKGKEPTDNDSEQAISDSSDTAHPRGASEGGRHSASHWQPRQPHDSARVYDHLQSPRPRYPRGHNKKRKWIFTRAWPSRGTRAPRLSSPPDCLQACLARIV